MCCCYKIGYAIRIYILTALILVQLLPHFLVIIVMQRALECNFVPSPHNLRFMFGYVAYFYRSKCVNLTELHFPIGYISPSPDRFLPYRDHETYTPRGTPLRYTWYLKSTQQFVPDKDRGSNFVWRFIGKRKRKRNSKQEISGVLKKRSVNRSFLNLTQKDVNIVRLSKYVKSPIPNHLQTEKYFQDNSFNKLIGTSFMEIDHKNKRGIPLFPGYMKNKNYPTKHFLVYITRRYGRTEYNKTNLENEYTTYDYGRNRSHEFERRVYITKDSRKYKYFKRRSSVSTSATKFQQNDRESKISFDQESTKSTTLSKVITLPKGVAKPRIPFKISLYDVNNNTTRNDDLLKQIMNNLKNLNSDYWNEDKIEFVLSLTDPINWILYFMDMIRGDLQPNSLVTMLTQKPYVNWPTWQIFDHTSSTKSRQKILERKNATLKPIERGHNFNLRQWITFRGREWPEWWDNHTTQGWIKIQEQQPVQIMWPYESSQYGWVRDWVTIWLITDVLWAIATFILLGGALARIKGASAVFTYSPFILVTFCIILMDLSCSAFFAVTIPNCADFWSYMTFVGVRNVGQLRHPKKVWFPDYKDTFSDAPWILAIFFLRGIIFWIINVIILFRVIHIFRRVVADTCILKELFCPVFIRRRAKVPCVTQTNVPGSYGNRPQYVCRPPTPPKPLPCPTDHQICRPPTPPICYRPCTPPICQNDQPQELRPCTPATCPRYKSRPPPEYYPCCASSQQYVCRPPSPPICPRPRTPTTCHSKTEQNQVCTPSTCPKYRQPTIPCPNGGSSQQYICTPSTCKNYRPPSPPTFCPFPGSSQQYVCTPCSAQTCYGKNQSCAPVPSTSCISTYPSCPPKGFISQPVLDRSCPPFTLYSGSGQLQQPHPPQSPFYTQQAPVCNQRPLTPPSPPNPRSRVLSPSGVGFFDCFKF